MFSDCVFFYFTVNFRFSLVKPMYLQLTLKQRSHGFRQAVKRSMLTSFMTPINTVIE